APDHGDAIRDLEDLVELVADEDDARALRAKLPEHAEDLARLLRREDGGWLVEDEDPRVAVDRLKDLNALLLADGELIDAGRGLDIEPQLLREQQDPLRRLGEVEDLADANDLLSENDVLGDREDRDQHEVLVHHADPACDRVGGVADRHGPAVDADLAFVRRDEAVEDVHERRLARAVLAEQRVDLAFAEVEVDRVVHVIAGLLALVLEALDRVTRRVLQVLLGARDDAGLRVRQGQVLVDVDADAPDLRVARRAQGPRAGEAGHLEDHVGALADHRL